MRGFPCVTLLLLLGALGCGYQFSGKGASFPKDVQTVFIAPLVNQSRDIGIERAMTSALKSEFSRQKQLQVVDRPEAADSILSGGVLSVTSRVVAVNKYDEALQYELSLSVYITLRRRSPDEVLWRTFGTVSEVYNGSRGSVVTTSSDFKTRTLNENNLSQFTDIQLTETYSQEARDRLVAQFARDIHQRLMELF